MSELQVEAATFREVLGHYPTGVCVITAMGAGEAPVGMVVGSFSSVSLDPPLVGFFPGKNTSSWPMIEAAGHFCVNVLASDQIALCKQIASPGDKFAGVEYTLSEHGLPILAGAMVSIECRVESVLEAGDHWLVLGRVLGLEATRKDADPLLFFRGSYGGFAGIS